MNFNMQKFFLKFKSFCLVSLSVISLMTIVFLFRQALVSDKVFKMTYPEVVFLNNLPIDKNIALISIRDLITPYSEVKKIVDVDVKGLTKTISELPWVENVSVIRDFPDVIKIVISSKQFYLASMCFFFIILSRNKVFAIKFSGKA